MTPEGRVKAAIKKYLTARGFWAAAGKKPEHVEGFYHMPVSNGMGVHGLPDFCCVYRGLAFYIEAKAPKGECTPNQLKRHEEIRAAGGYVVVARSVQDVADALLELEIKLTDRSPK